MLVMSFLGSFGAYWIAQAPLETRLTRVETTLGQIGSKSGAIQEPVPPNRESIPNSVSVLPFTFIANDKAATGETIKSYLTTALVTKLAEQTKVKVIPLSSVPTQANPQDLAKVSVWSDPQQVGRKLGAAYVVAGRITLLEGGFEHRLSLHLELIQVETGLLSLSTDTEISKTEVDGPFQAAVAKAVGEVTPKCIAKITGTD